MIPLIGTFSVARPEENPAAVELTAEQKARLEASGALSEDAGRGGGCVARAGVSGAWRGPERRRGSGGCVTQAGTADACLP